MKTYLILATSGILTLTACTNPYKQLPNQFTGVVTSVIQNEQNPKFVSITLHVPYLDNPLIIQEAKQNIPLLLPGTQIPVYKTIPEPNTYKFSIIPTASTSLEELPIYHY